MKIDINTLKQHLDNCSSYDIEDMNAEQFGNFTISCEDCHGGCEGAGEEHFLVIKVTDNVDTQYFLIPGFYQSYDGRSIEVGNLYEVEPYEKTERDWRQI